MKLSSIGKLTTASLVAGMAFAFTGTPADAQTIPSRIAVTDAQTNVVTPVQFRSYGGYHRSHRPYRRSFRRSHRRGFHGPSFGFGIGLGLAAPLLAAPFTAPRAYGYGSSYGLAGPTYGYGSSYGLAAPSYRSAQLVPGSAAWVEYCSQKYNSFDPASGTYLAYSGVRRTCKVP